jgi:hypothetical protein
MSINSQIRYCTHQQADKVKWDALVAASSNGLIYGYSFYLDRMAKQWDALVLNDYEAVMPLTWNKKYGILYLYQPFCCASLGIFGPSITAELTKSFLLNIPAKFRYRDISLNHGNLYNVDMPGLYERKNYVLRLHEPYEILYSRFSDNVKRNIKKATQNGCLVQNPPLPEVLQLAKLQLKQFAVGTNDDFTRFENLYHYLEQKNAALTYGIATAGGKLLSSCVFFLWQNRAYYILVGNHPDGKAAGTSHALINAFIKDYAGTNTILDFEGSDISSLASFYQGFGSQQENYPALKYNQLPALLKWIKK